MSLYALVGSSLELCVSVARLARLLANGLRSDANRMENALKFSGFSFLIFNPLLGYSHLRTIQLRL